MHSSTTASRRLVRGPRAAGFLAAAVLIAGLSHGVAVVRSQVTSTAQPPGLSATAPDATVPAAVALPGEEGQPAIGSIAQIDHSIRAWTTNLAANPKDFISATNLAILYHALGRLTGDLDDQTRALEAVQSAEQSAPTQTQAMSLEASIRYTLHDFSGSFAIADRLCRANSADLGALATRADAELELGRTAEAGRDYAAVAKRAPGPAIEVRLARLAYLTGDPGGALDDAVSARNAAATDEEADHGFYDFAVGEYARLAGQVAQARAAYVAALAIRPGDFASLVGLAKVDAADGHVSAAMAALKQAAAIVPQPETLTLLGDLEALQGDNEAAQTQYATVRTIRRLSEVSGIVYDRQLLLFELDHGGATPAILDSAESALAARTDAAGHDLVAWAAYRLGDYAVAARDIAAAQAGGIHDARILEHAGAIAIARNDRAGGASLLSAALALGPALDPLATAEAHRLLHE